MVDLPAPLRPTRAVIFPLSRNLCKYLCLSSIDFTAFFTSFGQSFQYVVAFIVLIYIMVFSFQHKNKWTRVQWTGAMLFCAMVIGAFIVQYFIPNLLITCFIASE